MIPRAKNNCVVLFGGLGNQLHQLAVGYFLANNHPVELDITSGLPQKVNGCVAISGYVLPSDVKLCQHSSNRFKKVIFLSLLKLSAKKFNGRFLDAAILALKEIACIFKIRGQSLFISHGVGFDLRVELSLVNRLLIGTFHSYEWVRQPLVLEQMRCLRMHNEPAWLLELKASSKKESPIVVHIRRGDYLGIRELGFLQASYYRKGISIAASNYTEKPIWIFSDQFDGVLDCIPNQFIDRVKFIDFDQGNAVANLEAMRLGSVYVLSNSTFSWWAATLSSSIKPDVLCPDRWFRSKPEPSKYIPDSWIRIPS